MNLTGQYNIYLGYIHSEKDRPIIEGSINYEDYRHIVFIEFGLGVIEIDGHTIHLQPGTIASIPAGAIISELHIERPLYGLIISMTNEFVITKIIPALPGLLKPKTSFWNSFYTVFSGEHFEKSENKEKRQQAFDEIKKAFNRLNIGCDPAVISYILLIILEQPWLKAISSKNQSLEYSDKANDTVVRFRQCIEKHFMEHLNISEYCRLLNITPRTLTNTCASAVQKKPLALIHERVLLEARRQIIYTDKSISEIAYNLGFNDVGYFSRFIKRELNVLPSELRK